jgi:hypothetical protein
MIETSTGCREGKNEVGELWFEKWYVNSDGTQDGWSCETHKEKGHTLTKWGEGQEVFKSGD